MCASLRACLAPRFGVSLLATVMFSSSDRRRLRALITDAMLVLCKSSLPYMSRLSVEALVGITVDDSDVILVNINKKVKRSGDEENITDDLESDDIVSDTGSAISNQAMLHSILRGSNDTNLDGKNRVKNMCNESSAIQTVTDDHKIKGKVNAKRRKTSADKAGTSADEDRLAYVSLRVQKPDGQEPVEDGYESYCGKVYDEGFGDNDRENAASLETNEYIQSNVLMSQRNDSSYSADDGTIFKLFDNSGTKKQHLSLTNDAHSSAKVSGFGANDLNAMEMKYGSTNPKQEPLAESDLHADDVIVVKEEKDDDDATLSQFSLSASDQSHYSQSAMNYDPGNDYQTSYADQECESMAEQVKRTKYIPLHGHAIPGEIQVSGPVCSTAGYSLQDVGIPLGSQTCGSSDVKKKRASLYRQAYRAAAAHKKKNYSCPYCDKSWDCHRDLLGHVATRHSGQRQFECSVCGRPFAYKRGLMQHVRQFHNGMML